MSDEALKNAKIAELDRQNEQLTQTVNAFSGQIRARSQAMQELFEANTNLRSSNFLLDDMLKKLEKDNQSLLDRISILEREKKELEEALHKSSIDLDAA